jgi:predicted amidohydrolase
MTTVSVAQVGSRLGAVSANLAQTQEWIARAADAGAELVVFPEATLSGYVFAHADDARAAAVRIDGAEADQLAGTCARHGIHAVVGMLELDSASAGSADRYYVSTALFGPAGLIGRYRKTHLARYGADRYAHPGADIGAAVFDTQLGRIGLTICYDMRFPETARSLSLAGAQLIAHAVAGPEAAGRSMFDEVTRVRALENMVFIAQANRPDEENGCRFRGRSAIVDPTGQVLARAECDATLLMADVDLQQATDKRIPQGDYELRLFEDRRPELYGLLVEERGGLR